MTITKCLRHLSHSCTFGECLHAIWKFSFKFWVYLFGSETLSYNFGCQWRWVKAFRLSNTTGHSGNQLLLLLVFAIKCHSWDPETGWSQRSHRSDPSSLEMGPTTDISLCLPRHTYYHHHYVGLNLFLVSWQCSKMMQNEHQVLRKSEELGDVIMTAWSLATTVESSVIGLFPFYLNIVPNPAFPTSVDA